MAFPTDFSNVSATDPITASRNNAITKKIGLTTIDTTDADNPIGHFSLPKLAGTPAGTPANGVGSLVWNSSANSLHVNTTGTTWANITGGSAFTEAVTIDVSSGVGLTIDSSGSGNLAEFQKDGNVKVTITEDGMIKTGERTAGGVQFGTDSSNVITGGDGDNALFVGPGSVTFASGTVGNLGILNGVSTIKQLSGSYGSGLALTSMAAGGSSIDQPMTFAAGAQVATGDQVAFDFAAEITKATSGNYTGIKLNVTETDVNAGNFLLDLQVGTTPKFSVDPDGTPIVPLQTPSSAGDTGTVGMIKWDTGYIYICTATDTWERVAVASW